MSSELVMLNILIKYSIACVKWPLSKRLKIGFQDQLSLNEGQKYCRMLQREQNLTFIKLPFVIKIFVLSIFERPFYIDFYCTVLDLICVHVLVRAHMFNLMAKKIITFYAKNSSLKLNLTFPIGAGWGGAGLK